MPNAPSVSPAFRWAWCGLALVLSQSSADGWLTAIWLPAGLLWRLLILGLAGLWIIEWRCRPHLSPHPLPAAIALLVTAIGVALDELIAVAGAGATPPVLSPAAPPFHVSLSWAGGALGACLWQIGWAAAVPSPAAPGRRGTALGLWVLGAGVWIWLLFPAGAGQPESGAGGTALAVLVAALLPPVERLGFARTGSPWPGAALRFLWWVGFVS